MGKVELKIDAELVLLAEAAGVEPIRAAEQGIRDALAHPTAIGRRAESAQDTVRNFDAGERRARVWAEANREAISEFNACVREHGLLSEHEPFTPRRWMR